MNKKTKSGLIFGITIAIFFIIQRLTTQTEQPVWIIILSGLIGGSVAGFLFSWLTGFTTKRN